MPRYDDDTIVLHDRMYIPAVHLDERRLEKHYLHQLYAEAGCRRCPLKPERHTVECDSCENYHGTVKTYNFKSRGGVDFYGIPLGDRANVEKKLRINFDNFEIVDKRTKLMFDYDIKLKGLTLYDYQEPATKAWSRRRYGFIIAPPRSGKTPTALYIAVRAGMRTMYLANQHEFLTQFIEHIEKYTNLPELEKKYGVKLYGFAKTLKDFDTLQIAVSTYHQFFDTDKGAERYARAKKNFGNCMVDEGDKAASNEFAKVLNNWPARYKTAFTGTFERKDGRHVIAEQIIGDVITRIIRPQMQAKLLVHVVDSTKSKSAYRGKAGFTYCCKFLANHKKRNEMILEYVGRDLEAGHHIVIPVYFKDHVFQLVKQINDLYGKGTAEYFVGGTGKGHKELREATLERAKSGKTKVIVGIRSILQRGLNVPKWSALYNIMPINNEPNWKQESSRVLTPMENKRQPIIRFFVDPNIGLSLGCFSATYKQSLGFDHIPTDKSAQQAAAMMRLHSAKRSGGGEPGEIDPGADDGKKRKYVDKKKSKKNAKTPKPTLGGLFGHLKKFQ